MICLSISHIILHTMAFVVALGQQSPLNTKTSSSTIRFSIVPTIGAKPIVIYDSTFQEKDTQNT